MSLCVIAILALVFCMGAQALQDGWLGPVITATLIGSGPVLCFLALLGGIALVRVAIYLEPQPDDFDCPNCGKRMKFGWKYCRACHRRVHPETAADTTNPFSA